jgi:hypothetical protein
VEEGFTIWSTEAERNDTRTAEWMGLSLATISLARAWHDAHSQAIQYGASSSIPS